jgi:hypothetical protein
MPYKRNIKKNKFQYTKPAIATKRAKSVGGNSRPGCGSTHTIEQLERDKPYSKRRQPGMGVPTQHKKAVYRRTASKKIAPRTTNKT